MKRLLTIFIMLVASMAIAQQGERTPPVGYGGSQMAAFQQRVIDSAGTYVNNIGAHELDNYYSDTINPTLFNVPAGWKTSRLFSAKPTDGSGDFTCVRASTVVRIDENGDSDTVAVNTPVIDFSTGIPLLIVSEVEELTVTTPTTATKVIINVDGVDVEYFDIFPTLTLPVGSIKSIMATDAGGTYDLLKAYLLRVDTATGTTSEDGASDLKVMYDYLVGDSLLDSTKLLYLSNAGMIQRVDGVLKFVRTAYDASENNNDLDGSATASLQPRLVGGIAPNSKVAAANQSGESRKFTHPTITVAGTYTTVKMMDTGGKYEFTYVEITTGTLTELTWTGNLRVYIVYAGTLSASDRTALEAKLYTLYPEIESVQIGTQTWATRNFEAVATPLGNVIANVTENGAVEKVVNGGFDNDTGWNKFGGSTISLGICTIPNLGYVISTPAVTGMYTAGKWYKYTINAKVVSGTGQARIQYGSGIDSKYITLTSSFVTYTGYFRSVNGSTALILEALSALSGIEIDSISTELLNWSNATEIYDAVYAATSGTTEEKEYAALKEAAAWAYHTNSVDLGATYSKIYNGYSKDLLVDDIASSTGWGYHVATEAELTALAALGGLTLKYGGTDYWTTDNGTNTTGLTALGGASRDTDGTFNTIKESVSYWCADSDKVLTILDDGTATIEAKDKLFGAYVRLVKD